MISKKMLSPLLVAAGLVAFSASSAERDTVIVFPADAVTQGVTPDAADVEVAPPQVSAGEIPVEYESDASSGLYRPRSPRPVDNAANPLGAESIVNPLEPSPG